MKATCILFFLFITHIILGQDYKEIEGVIVDKDTKAPIPYANIYSNIYKNGTISNADGYFRIRVNHIEDSIDVIFIGYKRQTIHLRADKEFYSVYLEENIQLLSEVTIIPKDNSYLFILIDHCKKNSSNSKTTAKAYYELKSFRDDAQIELVEGFYNINIAGYEIKELKLKAGRFALRPHENTLFTSLESSRAITMLKLLGNNQYFPKNPIELSKRELKKSYYLSLDKKYLNNDADSIYVVSFKPKNTTGLFFEGKIWINKTRKRFMKITLNSSNSLHHPFLPLFYPVSDISNVSFNITMTFTTVDNETVFNHIDFVYVIDYKSRVGKAEELTYSIKTNAILYAYDFRKSFFIPQFDFKDISVGDYWKIHAMPYNNFFWQNNDEYKLKDKKNINELFFSDTNSITSKTLFKSNAKLKHGLFERPYFMWSENRVLFRKVISDTSANNTTSSFLAKQYNLAVKFFIDVNYYNDSLNVLTATIFDPYESFYYLPIDNKTHCFINMFFDLCEIERRKLENILKGVTNDPVRIQQLYNEFLKSFEKQKHQYLKYLERGTNERKMLKWNTYIYEHIGINNFEIFKPYGETK